MMMSYLLYNAISVFIKMYFERNKKNIEIIKKYCDADKCKEL